MAVSSRLAVLFRLGRGDHWGDEAVKWPCVRICQAPLRPPNATNGQTILSKNTGLPAHCLSLGRFELPTFGPPDQCTSNRGPAQTPGNVLWPAVQIDHWFALFRDDSWPVHGLPAAFRKRPIQYCSEKQASLVPFQIRHWMCFASRY